jgi:hypothetical protein
MQKSTALTLAIAAALSVGSFFLGVYISPETLPTHTAYTQPCYPNAASAKMTLSYEQWTEAMEKQDPTHTGPLDTLIPTGPQKGEWVPPGCSAVEARSGLVTVWKMDDPKAPFWIPYPD